MSGAVWLTSSGTGKGFSCPCELWHEGGCGQSREGVDEEVPVVNISKQPAIMLLWLLEEACLQSPEKPVTCVNRICLSLGVEV